MISKRRCPIVELVIVVLLSVMASPETRADEDRELPFYYEITPLVAFHTGDTLRSSTLYGISLTRRFNTEWWVGIDYFGGQLHIDSGSGTNLTSGDDMHGVNGTIYFNLPGVLGAVQPDEGVVIDTYFSLGVGHLWLGANGEPYGFVGGGMVIWLPIRWMVLRFDVKNLFYNIDNSQGSDFNSDLSFNVGPSFVF